MTENGNLREYQQEARVNQEYQEDNERAESFEKDGIMTDCDGSSSLNDGNAAEAGEDAEKEVSKRDTADSRGEGRPSPSTKTNTRRMVTLALLVSAAMVLSYVESLLPALATVPGVKIGLANAVTLFALYALDTRGAICISVMRVSLSALLFGSTVSFIYSAAGAALSLLVMIILKRADLFSAIGVSVAGGVAHNVGQVLAASMTLESLGILYYIAPLLISGTLAGAFIGVVTGILTNKTKSIVRKILYK